MGPSGKRGRGDSPAARQKAFQRYQSRRAADGFEVNSGTVGTAWKSFVGERGQRLRALLQSFQLLGNSSYPPGVESSLQLVRDVLGRLGLPLPEVPAMRLLEWFVSSEGGRPQGWREVPSAIAQTSANDGRPAVAVGLTAAGEALAALVYPDEASNPANPTILMVGEAFVLDPGTVLQGFQGQPVRYFAYGK